VGRGLSVWVIRRRIGIGLVRGVRVGSEWDGVGVGLGIWVVLDDEDWVGYWDRKQSRLPGTVSLIRSGLSDQDHFNNLFRQSR